MPKIATKPKNAENVRYYTENCPPPRYFSEYTFFYRQLDFQSEPGVANKISENEPKSCLAVA